MKKQLLLVLVFITILSSHLQAQDTVRVIHDNAKLCNGGGSH